jgi:hypothetical protein
MALHAYGLLIGKVVGFREPRGRKPHWLLMVRPRMPTIRCSGPHAERFIGPLNSDFGPIFNEIQWTSEGSRNG